MKKQLILIITLMILLTPFMVEAAAFQFDPGNTIANNLDVTTANPRDVTINAIKWSLGILGIVAVTIILIGGFTWMTSAGNEEKVSKAKKILTYSIIGLLIILFSFILVSVIFKTGSNVSGLYYE